MIRLALVVAILLAAVIGAQVALEDPGYVLMQYGGWALETSVVILIAAVLLAFLVLYLAVRTAANAWALPSTVRHRVSTSMSRRGRRAFIQGLLALAEGRWKVAERYLLRSAERVETPLVAYLAAAHAAQQLGATDRRDAHLRQAEASTPAADVAVELTQAELQLADGEMERALATLAHLRETNPDHPYVLELLKEAYWRLRDWNQLLELSPELKRRKVLDAEQCDALERCAHRELLRMAASRDQTALNQTWEQVPRHLRREAEVLLPYAQGRLQLDGGDPPLEAAVRQGIEQQWSESLVLLYGELTEADAAERLTHAERWLRKRGQDPALLLTLARVAIQNDDWEKARRHLEASLAARPSVHACWELARLLERTGDHAAAAARHREGLALAVDSMEAAAGYGGAAEEPDSCQRLEGHARRALEILPARS